MILPRFSIKFLLVLIAGFGLASLIFAAAAQGSPWGVAITLAIMVVLAAPFLWVSVFLATSVLSLIGKAIQGQPRAGSPFNASKHGSNPSQVQSQIEVPQSKSEP